jgi:hypothetical protein
MEKQEKKYFNQGVDGDTQDFVLEQGAAINGQGFRYATTDKGAVGGLEHVASTRQIANVLPAGTNVCIGSTQDESRLRGLYFNWNSNGNHGIYCYDENSDTIYGVLLNSQVQGGLNFSKDVLIHSAYVVADMLYWVNDRLNQPRRINIEAGIKLNHPGYNTGVAAYPSVLKQEEISLIRKPPVYPIGFTSGGVGSTPGNFIRNLAFQFTYRYVYRDFEVSVLAMHSRTAGFLLPTETFNNWLLTVPLSEQINSDVLRIELVVKDFESNNYFIIKTWDKNDPDHLAEIVAHNAGTTALSYRFFNDQIGIAISDDAAAEPFHAIPIYSSTMEVARNRLFLANNDRGLTAPIKTSLTAQATVDEDGTLTGRWWRLEYINSGFGGTAVRFLIYVTDLPQVGWYLWSSGSINPITPVFPSTVPFSELSFIGPNQADVYGFYSIPEPFDTVIGFNLYSSSIQTPITGAPVNTTLVGKKVFKSGAAYRLAALFDDFADRHSGAVTKDSLKLVTANRQYGDIPYTRFISWSLSNANAAEEIPIEATTYSILVTKCLRTRSFQQIRANNMTYVGKDSSGLYTFNNSAYQDSWQGIGIDIGGFVPNNLGYTFSEGDLAKVYIGANVYDLAVKDTNGNWLIVELMNLTTLNSGVNALVEIYTPFKESFNEPFFEVALRYPILDPGTPNRRYSVLSGDIPGDVWIVERKKGGLSYMVEAMSPNDKNWRIWNTDAGRIAIVDRVGAKRRDRNICFSNVYLEGTNVNGLSDFNALDYVDLPIENGPIEKLILASKVQNEGSVMLAICRYDTSSIYLGEAQISDSSGSTAFFAKAQGVIGTINPLKGGFGTQNAESVCRSLDEDYVFWLDVNRECAVFYSSNGINSISQNNFTRFFREFCRKYKSLTRAQIEALGSRPFIPGVVDPHHKEAMWTIPRLLSSPPRGQLPDYDDLDFPYDIWDGQAKTIVYKYPLDRWYFPQPFTPEYFILIGNRLYGFKSGQMHQHNYPEGGYNSFYGTQYKSRIVLVANQEPSLVKIFQSLGLECNLVPDFVHIRTENPNIQSSDLVSKDFRDFEKIWYAGILRDRLTPTLSGSYTVKVNMGDRIRGTAAKIMLEWGLEKAAQLVQVKFVNIIYIDSQGHKV